VFAPPNVLPNPLLVPPPKGVDEVVLKGVEPPKVEEVPPNMCLETCVLLPY
jgi:hypothetical protein